jgi:predicted patatin/cPLA2 family phospholipase
MNNEVKFKNKDSESNALVVEGGAMRGIFSTGVLDAFLKSNFNPFHMYFGVSAGATNLASYLAEMYQRNYKVYTDYSVRPNFINWGNFITGGHLVNLDWLWDITIKEIRLDLEKICSGNKEYYVGVTEVNTGQAVYLKPNKNNLEDIIKASSSIPIFYRKSINIDEVGYVDGGLADPIPVIEAYKHGAKKIMVLRSRPYNYSMKSSSNNLLTRLYLKSYPALITAVENRARKYKESIEFMRNPPKDVKIIEINPPETFKTNRLTKNVSILQKDYDNAYNIGLEIVRQWNKAL